MPGSSRAKGLQTKQIPTDDAVLFVGVIRDECSWSTTALICRNILQAMIDPTHKTAARIKSKEKDCGVCVFLLVFGPWHGMNRCLGHSRASRRDGIAEWSQVY